MRREGCVEGSPLPVLSVGSGSTEQGYVFVFWKHDLIILLNFCSKLPSFTAFFCLLLRGHSYSVSERWGKRQGTTFGSMDYFKTVD